MFGFGISICFLQSIHAESMISSDQRFSCFAGLEPAAPGSQDENKSEIPIVNDTVATNRASEKPQSNTGSRSANETSAPGILPAGHNAGQQLVADSDSEEEEEWDMSRMGFRGPISIPVTGGGGLKRPIQKPQPKPSK
ncbi:hypothetical protein DFS33DRAFT_1385744 [Desarmillaria ectypa]|nr:hypothetical protein DFS33DRAFT_1385744 [Desarmillaria ectypa]